MNRVWKFLPPTKKPFVIAAEIIKSDGRVFGAPLGVEVAVSTKVALANALRRWPFFTLLEPMPWEKTSTDIRLAALKADREVSARFRLNVGILL